MFSHDSGSPVAYLVGVAVAFLIGVYQVIANTNQLLSAKTKNLKQVDLYYSCSEAEWVVGEAATWKYVFYVINRLILAPLFSWLAVGSFVVGVLLGVAKWVRADTSLVPERVKELRLRLERPGLTKREVVEILSAINEAQGGALELNPETGSNVTADRTKKRLTYNSHTPDWSGKFTSVYEYRLRGAIVEVRLIDDVSKWTDNTTENVRDGVVMEAVVARFPIAYLRDQRLAEFKANVEWHALESWRVRYYVLAQHPEEVPRSEVRRAVREDMERDRRMVERVCAAARGMGFPVSETDEGYQVERHPNDCDELGERLASACKAAGLAEGLSGLHRVTNAKAISRDYEALLI